MSFERLVKKIDEMRNPTVVGLDPKVEYVPEYIKKESYEKYGKTLAGAADAVLTFNKGLIDAIYDIVPAVKPQLAYYEMLGWEGVKVYSDTVKYAKSKGLYVIADGKRNDIGETMKAYSAAHIGKTVIDGEEVEAFGADALTVNGYLGSDGINPLVEACEKYDRGIFVLAKTSNKSSGELQDLLIGEEKVYEVMSKMCVEWGKSTIGASGYGAVGVVTGATYPEQLVELREKFPSLFFLVPGYGAQGAKAKDIAGAFDKNGRGAIVNSSRGIICAWKSSGADEKEYAESARASAIKMRDEIVSEINL